MTETVEMMLSDEQIAQNKAEFIKIWNDTIVAANRAGAAKLLAWLEGTDFFEAPASTRFHGAYRGGLCMHSLNVYHAFKELCESHYAKEWEIGPDSIALMALAHDFCKISCYKPGFRNVKNDETGKWEKVATFTFEDALPAGHGEKSAFLIERFMRLKTEEWMGIRWHMGGFDSAVKGGDMALNNAWAMYPSGAALHMADLTATHLMNE